MLHYQFINIQSCYWKLFKSNDDSYDRLLNSANITEIVKVDNHRKDLVKYDRFRIASPDLQNALYGRALFLLFINVIVVQTWKRKKLNYQSKYLEDLISDQQSILIYGVNFCKYTLSRKKKKKTHFRDLISYIYNICKNVIIIVDPFTVTGKVWKIYAFSHDSTIFKSLIPALIRKFNEEQGEEDDDDDQDDKSSLSSTATDQGDVQVQEPETTNTTSDTTTVGKIGIKDAVILVLKKLRNQFLYSFSKDLVKSEEEEENKLFEDIKFSIHRIQMWANDMEVLLNDLNKYEVSLYQDFCDQWLLLPLDDGNFCDFLFIYILLTRSNEFNTRFILISNDLKVHKNNDKILQSYIKEFMTECQVLSRYYT